MNTHKTSQWTPTKQANEHLPNKPIYTHQKKTMNTLRNKPMNTNQTNQLTPTKTNQLSPTKQTNEHPPNKPINTHQTNQWTPTKQTNKCWAYPLYCVFNNLEVFHPIHISLEEGFFIWRTAPFSLLLSDCVPYILLYIRFKVGSVLAPECPVNRCFAKNVILIKNIKS